MPRQESKTLDQVEKELAADKQPQDKRAAPKDFYIDRLAEGLYTIKWTAGGELPDALKGRWTNVARAQVAIDNFKLANGQDNS